MQVEPVTGGTYVDITQARNLFPSIFPTGSNVFILTACSLLLLDHFPHVFFLPSLTFSPRRRLRRHPAVVVLVTGSSVLLFAPGGGWTSVDVWNTRAIFFGKRILPLRGCAALFPFFLLLFFIIGVEDLSPSKPYHKTFISLAIFTRVRSKK